MQFPMPRYDAFAAHAPGVPSCQAGPHLAGHHQSRKLISATSIASHFDKDLRRMFINVLLLVRRACQEGSILLATVRSSL